MTEHSINHRRGRAGAVTVLLLALTSCAQTDPEVQRLLEHVNEPESATVPEGGTSVHLLLTNRKQPCVEAQLGARRLLLLIDTGSPGIVLDSSLANTPGITLCPGRFHTETPGGRMPCKAAILPEVRFGEAKVQGIGAVFVDLKDLRAECRVPGNDPLDGLLGGAVLPALGARIDFADNRLVLRPQEAPADMVAVPLLTAKGFRRYLEVQVNGEKVLFMVDTGANANQLDPSLASRNGVSPGPRGTITTLGDKGIAIHQMAVGRLPEMVIGPRSFRDIRVEVSEVPYDDETRNAGQKVVGWLGSQFMATHGFCIDYAHDCVYLRPGPRTGSSR